MSRDIKLENTLLVLQPDKKPLLKLCDFGYSKVGAGRRALMGWDAGAPGRRFKSWGQPRWSNVRHRAA